MFTDPGMRFLYFFLALVFGGGFVARLMGESFEDGAVTAVIVSLVLFVVHIWTDRNNDRYGHV